MRGIRPDISVSFNIDTPHHRQARWKCNLAFFTDSIIGFWRTVKSESSDKKDQNPTGELEMRFADTGVVTLKLRDPANGAATTQTIEGKFTLVSPDRVTITLDGRT